MNISGSVGYTLLKLKSQNKYVLLFADIHDDVNYCKQDSVMIDTWLDNKDNNDILLEEAVREKLSLTELWPGSLHTKKLQELNRNNHKIKPIDVRPLLIPFSWELSEINKELSKMSLKEYISKLEDLFNLKKTKFMLNYIYPEVKKLGDSIFKVSLLTHFNELKELFEEFKEEYKKYMEKTILYLFRNNPVVLERINNLTSLIMEWYILVLIHNSDINTIIHVGLAHSNRLLDLLSQVYRFEVLKESGINRMSERHSHNACVKMPEDISDIF